MFRLRFPFSVFKEYAVVCLLLQDVSPSRESGKSTLTPTDWESAATSAASSKKNRPRHTRPDARGTVTPPDPLQPLLQPVY